MQTFLVPAHPESPGKNYTADSVRQYVWLYIVPLLSEVY